MLSFSEAQQFETHGIRPSCDNHPHLKPYEVAHYLRSGDMRQVISVERIIVNGEERLVKRNDRPRLTFLRKWDLVKRYRRTGLCAEGAESNPHRQLGPGMPVMQLVR